LKPEFVDNREVTMAAAIAGHLDWIHATYREAIELSIATGYFNPEGFALLADRLERLPKVRLLLGAEPTPPPARSLRLPGEPRGERWEAKQVETALNQNAEGLRRDRDRLGFTATNEGALRRLLDFLATGKLEVRRYERAFLHGKAFIFETEEGFLSGSSNFTAAGLTSNLELNLGRYDPAPVARVRQWFDTLWQDSRPYDLAALYAERFAEYEPYLIYLRVLWERYGSELEAETPKGSKIRLTTFQTDGVFRALQIAEHYHGVLIADGVGLGKTFIAGELIRQAVEDRRQRALLVAPATLRDGAWARFAARYQLYVECVSYEELARDRQLGGDGDSLKQLANDYALVVIDEAQAFRNPDTRRAQALRRLLQGRPPKTLVLLSATPVNNSLWDLYYLLTYFVGHDAAFSSLGVKSLKERFAQGMREDPDDLKPDALFDILDATTVRRTRHFVRRFYPNDRVIGPGGVEIPVQFPEPHVHAVKYSLDDVLPGFFEEFARALAPADGEPKLTLARYAPGQYRPGAPLDPREAALVGLLRSGLLKRFESSAHAFAVTAERMAEAHDRFLMGLDRGLILTAQGLEEWEQTDSDEAIDELLRETGSTTTAGYDVERLRADVEADRNLLRGFAKRAEQVSRAQDPKLKQLVEELRAVARQAANEGLGEDDARNRRKVLVFSYFADTVDWIREHLADVLARDRQLAVYRGRVAAISGDESRGDVSRAEAMFGFAPVSTEAPAGRADDRFDILVTTDVLAEGVNLQQCRHVVNYDLPWNPMRLVQRHGRVDRIGSPHRDVYVRCFFPDQRLDALLALEGRIRRKLAQAAAAVGIEHEVIPGAATSDIVFSQTRDEIEALRREQADLLENAGEDPRAHSGEEYRQELRKGLERYGDRIETLPGAAGSGFAGGAATGHFFCAKVGTRLFLRFLTWGREEIVRDTLGCLRLIACREDTPRVVPKDLADGAYDAWRRARRDIFGEWMQATDPANLQPRVRPTLRAAGDHLRRYPPPGLTQEEIDRVVESLEAPWGARVERIIREAMTEGSGPAISIGLVAKVRLLGLQPYRPPDPLPPIDEDEVTLICWLAVSSLPGGA
jgi:hypothetical protein